MDGIKYTEGENLLKDIYTFGSIHVECNPHQAQKLCQITERLYGRADVSYVTSTDTGYDREKVTAYLKFFRNIYGSKAEIDQVLDTFCLKDAAKKKIWTLNSGERTKLQLARVSMSNSSFMFIEEPLLNLDQEAMRKVLQWMEERSENGTHFITTNASLKYALFMPGKAFYLDEGIFYEVLTDEQETDEEEQEMAVLKIPAKSGDATLLFEPKDIDFIESLNRNNYVTVRGSAFPVQYTMDELEHMLQKSGFFRCHRSYIVNVQKVQRLERMTKNSYVLILNDKEESQVPLSKGRIEEMKNTFGW